MSALHIVNHAIALSACLEVAHEADSVLLIEDGVYAAVITSNRRLFALDDDVRARGLLDRVQTTTELVGYGDFVELVVSHQPVISWR